MSSSTPILNISGLNISALNSRDEATQLLKDIEKSMSRMKNDKYVFVA